MQRRDFITGLGGAASWGPRGVGAQQPERMRRIGVLMKPSADDPDAPTRVAAFAQRTGQNRRERPISTVAAVGLPQRRDRPKFYDQVRQCCKIGPGTLF
jgi:hypothetical protein